MNEQRFAAFVELSGGVECLEILRDEVPVATVASVDMPWGGIDGLLDYLSEESDPQFGHFVILTGYTAEENVGALTQSPCVFRYLRKPFLMALLLDHVRAIEFDVRAASRAKQEPSGSTIARRLSLMMTGTPTSDGRSGFASHRLGISMVPVGYQSGD